MRPSLTSNNIHQQGHAPLRIIALASFVTVWMFIALALATNTATATTSVATDVTAGEGHSCAVVTGEAYCWGINNWRQLGDGTNVQRLRPNKIVFPPTASTITDIDAGLWHTCAVDTAGSAWCWGRNNFGAIGDGTSGGGSDSFVATPSRVDFPDPEPTVTKISAGAWHTCAIDSDGAVWCWGLGGNGRLGTNSQSDQLTPVQVIASGATSLDLGNNQSCAVVSGVAKCWGYNDQGQLGDGSLVERLVPTNVYNTNLGTSVKAISSGVAHSCAIKGDDTLWCWGDNAWEKLGLVTYDPQIPTSPVGGDGVNPAASVAAGLDHTCAIGTAANPGIFCAGHGTSGEMGQSDAANNNSFQKVHGITTQVTAIAAGNNHTCAIVQAEIACWGLGGNGQLGDGTQANRSYRVFAEIAPVVTVSSPADGLLTGNATVEVSFTTSGLPEPSCKVNGVDATSPYEASLDAGVNALTVTCTNAAGSDSKTVNVARSSAPAVAITSPANGLTTKDASVSVSFSVTGYPQPSCTVGGVAASSPTVVALSIGSNAIQVSCTNSSGTDTKTVQVDRRGPAGIVSAPKTVRAGKSISLKLANCSTGCSISLSLKIGKKKVKGLKRIKVAPGATRAKIKLPSKVVKRIKAALRKSKKTKVSLRVTPSNDAGRGAAKVVRIR